MSSSLITDHPALDTFIYYRCLISAISLRRSDQGVKQNLRWKLMRAHDEILLAPAQLSFTPRFSGVIQDRAG